MPIWTLFGLTRGKATTNWPRDASAHGQDGLLGMPRFHADRCQAGCSQCVAACPTGAIHFASEPEHGAIDLDYGKCIVCQLCVEACPNDAMQASHDWAFGVCDRQDLVLQNGAQRSNPEHPVPREPESRRGFRRSLHIRHVDSGSCNGCESELQALNNPFYNLHRFGIFFTASPRFADLLLVTGPVTYAMHEPLKRSYEAMPEPRWVMAVGTCAVSGGLTGGGYACGNGLDGVIPVDLYLPGCPPNPAAIIDALLMFLDRRAQHVHGGRVGE
jgi:formate hydrogenlyase subunit 7